MSYTPFIRYFAQIHSHSERFTVQNAGTGFSPTGETKGIQKNSLGQVPLATTNCRTRTISSEDLRQPLKRRVVQRKTVILTDRQFSRCFDVVLLLFC